jgi:hypothetical protein
VARKPPYALTGLLIKVGVRPKLAEAITRSVDWLDRVGEGSDGLASLLWIWAAAKELEGYACGKDEAQMVVWVEPHEGQEPAVREDMVQ